MFLAMLNCCDKATNNPENYQEKYGNIPTKNSSSKPDLNELIDKYCSKNMLISRFSDFDPNRFYSLNQELNLTRGRGGRGGGGGSSRGNGGGSSSGNGGYSSSDSGTSTNKGGGDDSSSNKGDGGNEGSSGNGGSGGNGGDGGNSGSGSQSGSGNGGSNSSKGDGNDSTLTEEAVRENLEQKNYVPLVNDKKFMFRRAYIYRGHNGYSQTQSAITNGADLNDLWSKHNIRMDWDPNGYWIICYEDNKEKTLLIFRGQDGSYRFYSI